MQIYALDVHDMTVAADASGQHLVSGTVSVLFEPRKEGAKMPTVRAEVTARCGEDDNAAALERALLSEARLRLQFILSGDVIEEAYARSRKTKAA